MKVVVVHSDRHALHDVDRGLWVGVSIPTDEVPARADAILAAMLEAGREVVGPTNPSEGHALLRSAPQVHFYERLERFLDWHPM